MNPISPLRSLMQVKEGSNEDNEVRKLLIGGGAVLLAIMALALLACVCGSRRRCRINSQNRKYADWTGAQGVLDEFRSSEVSSHRNPLLIAIEVMNVPLVKKLVEDRTQSCTDIDPRGNYALLVAAGTRSLPMVKYIAGNTPADFHPQGRSALHEAAYHEDLEVLSFLIQKFPKLQTNRDGEGKSYLQELCVEWIGSDFPQPRLKQGSKYLQFINLHRKFIPNNLFKGTLEPYRDLSNEEITIKMASIDSESEALL